MNSNNNKERVNQGHKMLTGLKKENSTTSSEA